MCVDTAEDRELCLWRARRVPWLVYIHTRRITHAPKYSCVMCFFCVCLELYHRVIVPNLSQWALCLSHLSKVGSWPSLGSYQKAKGANFGNSWNLQKSVSNLSKIETKNHVVVKHEWCWCWSPSSICSCDGDWSWGWGGVFWPQPRTSFEGTDIAKDLNNGCIVKQEQSNLAGWWINHKTTFPTLYEVFLFVKAHLTSSA